MKKCSIVILLLATITCHAQSLSVGEAIIQDDESVKTYSKGSNPGGVVNAKVIAAMKELNCNLSKHDNKSVKQAEQFEPFDTVVTMGCGDGRPPKNLLTGKYQAQTHETCRI